MRSCSSSRRSTPRPARGGAWRQDQIEPWALYIAVGSGWKLGGLAPDSGHLADLEILRFERVAAGTHHGYRFDIATSARSAVRLDPSLPTPSLLRATRTTFCSGRGYRCITVVSTCEQIVRGQTVLAFDGKITVADDQIQLTGTGTQPSCSGDSTFSANLR